MIEKNEKELNLTAPQYNEEEFNKKYAELGNYKVVIPPAVDALGYAGINKLFSEIQRYLDRVAELMSEAERLYGTAKVVYEASKAAYEAKYDATLSSHDPKQFESIKILESKVRHALKDDRRFMDRSRLTMGLFSAYRKSVEGTLKNLETTRKTLEIQNNNYKRQNPLPTMYPVQAKPAMPNT